MNVDAIVDVRRKREGGKSKASATDIVTLRQLSGPYPTMDSIGRGSHGPLCALLRCFSFLSQPNRRRRQREAKRGTEESTRLSFFVRPFSTFQPFHFLLFLHSSSTTSIIHISTSPSSSTLHQHPSRKQADTHCKNNTRSGISMSW